MKVIKEMSGLIDEEIDDAEKYAHLAMVYKEEMPDIAELFFSLSLEEIKHMNMLHNAVVQVINKHKDDDDPRTEGMKLAHEFIHEQEIKKENKVRVLQAMFRE